MRRTPSTIAFVLAVTWTASIARAEPATPTSTALPPLPAPTTVTAPAPATPPATPTPPPPIPAPALATHDGPVIEGSPPRPRSFYESGWFWGAIGAGALFGGAIFLATRDSGAPTIHLEAQVPH